uniref:Uncharacterized protein n=1 Tax=Panagrolaimus sp. ES5 TaxID=591445 RepID=A0AC34G6D1_9BILA
MKFLILIGILLIVELSHQRSIIPPPVPAEESADQINVAKHTNEKRELKNNDEINDNRVDKQNGDNQKNAIEEYLKNLKLSTSKLERKGRKIEIFEIPEIEIPEIAIPEIEIPDIEIPEITIPEITDIKIDFAGKKVKENKEKRRIINPEPVGADKNVEKRAVDSESMDSIEKLLQGKNGESLDRIERGNDKIEIIDLDGDLNEMIDKVVDKYSDKEIRVFHVRSLKNVSDDVIEFDGDIYVEKNPPKVTSDLYVMVIL